MGRDEFQQIEWIRAQVAADPRVPIGIGDDAALLKLDRPDLLWATDMLIEDVHFDLRHEEPFRVGQKAVNVNLSDIAAMGGWPTALVVAVALPRQQESHHPSNLADDLFHGLHQAAQRFNVSVVGGDTNRSNGPVVISVSVIGHPLADSPITRAGVCDGDDFVVTGSLGYSRHGHHLDFVPRLDEARWLVEHCTLHAMIDISDGLAGDIVHFTAPTGLGFEIDAESLPIRSSNADPNDQNDPVSHALSDGEDFELLFSLPHEQANKLITDQPLLDLCGTPLTRVGRVIDQPGIFLRRDGQRQPLACTGFRHH